MNKHWSFYSLTTGLLDGGSISIPEGESPDANVPAGHAPIEGEFDSLSQRVDLATMAVVDYQPPAPLDTDLSTWEWDATARRWAQRPTLARAQADKIASLSSAYAAAIQAPVTFTTAAGVAQTYQADPQSVSNAVSSMLGCQASASTPPGFFWVAADNSQVLFTYADLQGLAAAMFQQGHTLFARLQALKGQVRAATDSGTVQAIAW